LNIQL
jgi:dynein heavy chain